MAKKDKSAGPAIVLGIDLGGTKILATVIDQQGRILGDSKRKTKPHKGVDAVIERIAKTAVEAVEDAGLDFELVQAIGIGAPGVADYHTGVIEFAPNLQDWVNVPLGPRLEAMLGVPVVVANDVNAGTFGEATAGAARGFRSVVGLFPGTGIGGGIVLDGKLWRGARNAAAELGHMVVMIDGPLCGCGRRGCIEGLASRTAIERDIRGEIRGGRASLITELVDLDDERITSGTLAKALKKGDGLVTDVLQRASYHLGILTAAVVNALDPECVVYGGGLVEACADFMLPIIRDTTYHYLIRPVDPEHLPILEAQLGDNATAIGAAMLASVSLTEVTLA
jgi:glucokinase